MQVTRLRGPIPEKQIDQSITRDNELDWSRILNKPTTFPPSTHTHFTLTTQLTNNFSTTTGGQSGFYESSNGSALNTPLPGWHHLISCEHNNPSPTDRYAFQFASYYYGQRFFVRNIIASNNPEWLELLHFGNRVEAWQAPTFTVDFWNYGETSTIQPLRFRKNNSNNSVEIIGNMMNTTANIFNTQWYSAFTLPVGYRPSKSRIFPIKTGSGTIDGSLAIDTGGNVTVFSQQNLGPNSRFSIEVSMPLI